MKRMDFYKDADAIPITLSGKPFKSGTVMNDTRPDFKADLNDHSPLYMQVARKLTQEVRDGRYQVGQALPSERMLSEQLDVSRVTARKAIDQLVDQGLVVRRRGSGNYVAPRILQPLSNLSSFSEQLAQRGY